MKTRIWHNRNSTTMVQFISTANPKVYLQTNIGWLPIGNTPENDDEAQKFAEDCAVSYGLVEGSQEMANYFAGVSDENN